MLRQQLNNNKALDRTSLRTAINHTTKQISKRLKHFREDAADQICKDMSNTTDSRKMFEAVRSLNSTKTPVSMGVHNEQGCLIATDAQKAKVVRYYLQKKLTKMTLH